MIFNKKYLLNISTVINSKLILKEKLKQNILAKKLVRSPKAIQDKIKIQIKTSQLAIPILSKPESDNCIEIDCDMPALFMDPIEHKLVRCRDHIQKNDYIIRDNRKKKWDGKTFRDVCEYYRCIKQPRFGNPEDGRKRHCSQHCELGEKGIGFRLCEIPGCETQPTYGNPSDMIARRCKKDQHPEDIDVHNKKCEVKGCPHQPTYGDASDMLHKRCKKHMLPTDEDVRSKRCEYIGCKTQPIFGDVNDMIRKRCFTHKSETDMDVSNKRCEHHQCTTRPSFGCPIELVVKRCKTHAIKDSDIDLISKMCEYPNCKISASFGDENEDIARRCKKHKLCGYINLRGRFCECFGCKVHASFGDPEDMIPLTCFEHMKSHYENVVSKRCEAIDCKTMPVFGNPIDRIRKRCCEHKELTDKDVVSKKCARMGCDKQPSYGNPNDMIPVRCAEHKLGTDGDVKHKLCEKSSCIVHANFGDPIDQIPKRCASHISKGDVDVTNRKCNICNKHQVRYGDICAKCDPSVKKRKEYVVVEYLETHANELLNGFTHNRTLSGETGKMYRPDLLFLMTTHAVILEIDEHQHKRYNQIQENQRMIELQKTLNSPTIFIRFNPDEYRSQGKLVNPPLENRLTLLSETILNCIEIPCKDRIDIVKICYDDQDLNPSPNIHILQKKNTTFQCKYDLNTFPKIKLNLKIPIN